MDPDTQAIIERTKNRRLALAMMDDNLDSSRKRANIKSPKASPDKKRPSLEGSEKEDCEDDDAHPDIPDLKPVPVPRRSSLYPVDELENMANRALHSDSEEQDVVEYRVRESYSRTVEKKSHSSETDSISATTRKSRFARLAAAVDDFEVEEKRTPIATSARLSSRLDSPNRHVPGSPVSVVDSPKDIVDRKSTPLKETNDKPGSDCGSITPRKSCLPMAPTQNSPFANDIFDSPKSMEKVENTNCSITSAAPDPPCEELTMNEADGSDVEQIVEITGPNPIAKPPRMPEQCVQGPAPVKPERSSPGRVSVRSRPLEEVPLSQSPGNRAKGDRSGVDSTSSKVSSLANKWEKKVRDDPNPVPSPKSIRLGSEPLPAKNGNSVRTPKPSPVNDRPFRSGAAAPLGPKPITSSLSSGMSNLNERHESPFASVGPKYGGPASNGPIALIKRPDIQTLRKRWEQATAGGQALHPDQSMVVDGDELTATAIRVFSPVRSPATKSIPVDGNATGEADRAPNPRILHKSEVTVPSIESSSSAESTGDSADESPAAMSSSGHAGRPPADAVSSCSQATTDDEEVFDSELDDVIDEAIAKHSTASLKTKLDEKMVTPISTVSIPPPAEKGHLGTPLTDFLANSFSSSSEKTPASKAHLSSGGKATVSGSGTDLMYTLSFYRSQSKNPNYNSPATPVRAIVKSSPEKYQKVQKVPNSGQQRRQLEALKDKLRMMNGEVTVQQSVISQVSRALNVCRSKDEFRGSMEEIEAERHLLLANAKKQAVLGEIDRITRILAENSPVDGELTGTLGLTHIVIPLKRDFVNQIVNGTFGFVYHFICLVKHHEQVIATNMVSSEEFAQAGRLEFPNYIQIASLGAHFIVTMEIYALQTGKVQITHNEKYHSGPLRSKEKKGNSLSGMFTQSGTNLVNPAGVRTTSFNLIGTLRIDLSSVEGKRFQLTGVPFSCPIENYIHMNLRCHCETVDVEEAGFLNIHEEISGFGAWNRRWCRLSQGLIRLWRYPDEENKDMLGYFDLTQCVTMKTKTVDKELCARPHTFMLEFDIRDVIQPDSDVSVDGCYRVLISADSKDECANWCAKLNEVLRNNAMWNPSLQAKPEPPSFKPPEPFKTLV